MKMNKNMDRLRDSLVIDRDSIGDCLIDQPQLFYDVARGHAESVARRDALKLDTEEVQAEADRGIRAAAAVAGDKITEASIQQTLRLDPKVADLSRKGLSAREESDRWAALKEAYQQRSFMLRELVALRISERSDIAQAHGAGQRPRYTAADAVVDHVKSSTADARRQFRVRGK